MNERKRFGRQKILSSIKVKVFNYKKTGGSQQDRIKQEGIGDIYPVPPFKRSINVEME